MPSDNRSLFIHFNVKTIHSVLNLSERVKIHSYKWSCPFKMLLSGHTITYKVFFSQSLSKSKEIHSIPMMVNASGHSHLTQWKSYIKLQCQQETYCGFLRAMSQQLHKCSYSLVVFPPETSQYGLSTAFGAGSQQLKLLFKQQQ